MTNGDWRAEEYKALRAEILANMDYQKNLVIWGTAGLVTVLTLIFKDATAYAGFLLILAQLLASALWYTWEALAINTERIGSYIAQAHERFSSCNWELFQRSAPVDPSNGEPVSAIGDPKRVQVDWLHLKTPKRRYWNFFLLLPFILVSVLCCALLWLELPVPRRADGAVLEPLISDRLRAVLPYVSTGILGAMAWLTWRIETEVKKTENLWTDTMRRLAGSQELRHKLGWKPASPPVVGSDARASGEQAKVS